MNINMIRIGNRDNSKLILSLDLPFSKIKLIPNLNLIVKDYFLDDIKIIYVTNKEELQKGLEGHLLKFTKENLS